MRNSGVFRPFWGSLRSFGIYLCAFPPEFAFGVSYSACENIADVGEGVAGFFSRLCGVLVGGDDFPVPCDLFDGIVLPFVGLCIHGVIAAYVFGVVVGVVSPLIVRDSLDGLPEKCFADNGLGFCSGLCCLVCVVPDFDELAVERVLDDSVFHLLSIVSIVSIFRFDDLQGVFAPVRVVFPNRPFYFLWPEVNEIKFGWIVITDCVSPDIFRPAIRCDYNLAHRAIREDCLSMDSRFPCSLCHRFKPTDEYSAFVVLEYWPDFCGPCRHSPLDSFSELV